MVEKSPWQILLAWVEERRLWTRRNCNYYISPGRFWGEVQRQNEGVLRAKPCRVREQASLITIRECWSQNYGTEDRWEGKQKAVGHDTTAEKGCLSINPPYVIADN